MTIKWDLEIRGTHRIFNAGRFRILQTATDVALEHPGLPVLFYPTVDMAKKVAGYLQQGGMSI